MPLPALPCISCIVPPVPGCLNLPGGASLCVSLPSLTIPTASEYARQLFAQVNSALTPLLPAFAIMDVVKALGDCVQAIPDAIVKLDPVGLIECAPALIERLAKVASMFPPLSIPIFARDVLSLMILMLQGLQEDLAGAQQQLDRILEASTAAQLPGNSNLLAVVVCAQNFYDAIMSHIAAGATPLNRLIGLINMFLGFIPGAPVIPCIGGLDGAPSIVLTLIEKFIQVLTLVRNLIPGGFKLTPYTPKGAGC